MRAKVESDDKRPEDEPSVLVVDDNPLIVDVIRNLLRSQNYKVFTSSNGKEALEVLDSKKVDVILCDVMMPRMGGHEFHEVVREKPECAHIPFIFLTALDSEDDREHGKASGADDYLCKPFEPRELLAVIRGKIVRGKKLKNVANERYDAYRRRVIHTLSHEFRTPLVAINTGMELLLEQSGITDNNRTKSLLDAVRRGGQRLEKLVADFMVLQQIDAGIALRLYETRAAQVKVSELLKCFMQTKAQAFVDKGTVITVRDESEGKSVYISDSQILDCLDRIVSNAVKFSRDDKRVEIEARISEAEVLIEVKDRGIGLDPDKLGEAADVFGQINREKLEQQGGGLGLPIATHYATINKGRLEFEPRRGGGSIICLVLPVA